MKKTAQHFFSLFLYIVSLQLAIATPALGCSSFMLHTNNTTYVAKNYDWQIGDGYIISNPRGLKKKSLLVDPSLETKWISQFSSVTFNQYGVEHPNGGINEKGLIVEILWLDQTQYPTDPTKPRINELQWIQYQLDNYSTTKEVVQNVTKLNIQKIYGSVHYFVCDKTKDCAAIEFIKGKPAISYNETLKYPALTNNPYQLASSNMENYKGYGGSKDIPLNGNKSLDRFVRLNHYLDNYDEYRDPVDYSFHMLASVRKVGYTQWQIIYDTTNSEIYFETTFTTTIRSLVQAKNLFADCKSQRSYFDLTTDLRGEITKFFKPLDLETNKKLVKKSLSTIMPNMPVETIDKISSAPFQFTCI